MLFQSPVAKQGIGIRLCSTELAIKFHGVFAPAFFENVFTECFGCRRVEDTVFFECVESIGIENFGPDVAVISCTVIVGEDVREVGATVAIGDFVDESDGLRYFFSNWRTSYSLTSSISCQRMSRIAAAKNSVVANP